MRDVLILLGIVAAAVWIIQLLVGWLMLDLLISIAAFIFLVRTTITVTSHRMRFLFALCALLWIGKLILSLLLGFSEHRIFCFLLAVAVTLVTFKLNVEFGSVAKQKRFFGQARTVWILLLVLIYSGYGLLTWNDYRWWPVLIRASHWESNQINDQLSPKGPVLILRTDIERKGYLERVAGLGRFPRVSDVNADTALVSVMPFAGKPEDVHSVIMIGCSFYQVGEYLKSGDRVGTGSAAYRCHCEVNLVDLEAGQRKVWGAVTGPSPPSKGSVGPEYGDQPSDEDLIKSIGNWWNEKSS
jgi:hypothetical protein